VVTVLGRSHALSGAVAGIALGSVALHEPAGSLAMLCGLTAAFALAPDIDQCGSTDARSLGFVTQTLAWVIRKLSGGHRHGTHSLAGVGLFTAAAWLACLYRYTWPGRIVLAVILAAGIAAAADALRPGPAHGENVLGLAAAGAMCWTGYGLALVPIAAAVGTGVHIAGDMLTVEGCPLAWPLSARHFGLPRPLSFTTGTWRENWIVVPVLVAAFLWLSYRDLAG
jgi:membrane-bound metal-dependent hydrolase YbcI (DUF457 family)